MITSGGSNGAYSPIGEYALIGDGRAAGLISRDGSLDWLSLPRFDSPPIFGALLDDRKGGRFRVRPVGPFGTERRYLPDTNVLETIFRTSTGALALRDLMPVTSEDERRRQLTPDHEVLRQLECLEGEVEVEVLYAPRPDFGRGSTRLRDRGAFGLWLEWQAGRTLAAFVLRSDIPLSLDGDGEVARGVARLGGGECAYLSLAYEEDAPAVVPSLGRTARERVERSARWWREWAGRCTYHGPYREAVVRSALVLKLLVFAPSGAIVAAPTTSLPEWLGGVRNWDYRYCWLRDASFSLRALLDLGYWAEAEAFFSWMLHATRLTWPELQVVYDVYGEANLPERQLPHLDGYAGSRPVRIGNDAHSQLQLDVYGEVLDAISRFADRGGRLDRDTSRMVDGLGRTVCRRWKEPDEGIWEGRAGRFHHTHSKVLCWVALDRLVRLHEAGRIRVSVDEFRAYRDEIRAAVEARGYNSRLRCYTRTFDGEELDASLLTLPYYGYVAATDPRMRATCDRIRAQLGREDLVYRYQEQTDDGLPRGEGAFGVCSFWLVECLVRLGEVVEATKSFEHLLGYANDVGLFAEEIDPATGEAIGNFPQALTHLGLINAALSLAEVQGERMAAESVERVASPSTEVH